MHEIFTCPTFSLPHDAYSGRRFLRCPRETGKHDAVIRACLKPFNLQIVLSLLLHRPVWNSEGGDSVSDNALSETSEIVLSAVLADSLLIRLDSSIRTPTSPIG
jgi:hypothetical protein